MTALSEHFTDAELACPCGCGLTPQQSFIDLLEKLRAEFGHPLRVNSGARCAAYNNKIGGKTNSLHLSGCACDLSAISGQQKFDILRAAIRVGMTGIGVAATFIHVDARPVTQRAVWTY